MFAARIIPYRGSWLDIEFDAKDIVHARIDRRRKIPVTSLLFALGLDGETILNTFYKQVPYKRQKDGWRVPFDANRFRGYKAVNNLVDADSGRTVVEAGHKITVRQARQLQEKGLKALRMSDEELIGHYIAEDLVNTKTGEIYAEAGEEITEKSLKVLNEAGYKEIPILDIDHVNVGAYIRNTLTVDKNMTREDALFDIYRVMRPGEPPTLDTAQLDVQLAVLRQRALRPFRGRPRQDEHAARPRCADTVRVLRKDDIVAVIRTLLDLRDGKGEIDDIDHLGNRRVRSVGELMENQYRIGLLRMERAIKERMSSVDIDTVMPQDLINAKPAAAAVREFFGSSQLSQFMDQTNPLSEITHKRRLSALGPGGLTRERAGFEVRDVHPTHYGRICPIETPEGPNIGLINSLATYARVNKYGFVETPYRKVKDGKVTDEVAYLSAMEEGRYTVAQANATIDARGKFAEDMIVCRHAGDVLMVPREKVDYMDVSPKQLVSVAAALIPFLENDDANRALMGSNMQRQAVPLVRAEAPFVGTGMEGVVARDSGAAIAARRTGMIDQVDATRIVIRATQETDPSKSGVDIYRLMKFQRSNQNTCINQRPLVKVGDHVRKGDIIADGPSTELGELALGRNVLVAFMPWNGYNFEDFDPALRAHRQGRRLHLDPHRRVRGDGPRHQAGPRGNHSRHPERLGRGAQEPRRSGHRLHRRGGPRRRHPVRQDHAEGRKPDDAGREAAARHLRREGLGRARHLAARAAGRAGHRRRSARVQPPRRRQGRARARDRARGDRAARQGPRRRAGDPRSQRVRPSFRDARRPSGHRRPEGLQEGLQDHQGGAGRVSARAVVAVRLAERQAHGRDRGHA